MSAPEIIALLDRWLLSQLKAETTSWLRETCNTIAKDNANTRTLFIAFGIVGRRSGRADVQLSIDDRAAAFSARQGWDPSRWSLDQMARARLLLAMPATAARVWLITLDQLFAAAGLEELVALYQALPLLPHQDLLAARIAEGVRSNMKPVFNAIALDNPAPSERLDEGAWNQLVLKALFIASPVARIVDATARANPTLAHMLIDYARERLAAQRPVPVDLWDAARPGCNPIQRAELNRLHASAPAVTA